MKKLSLVAPILGVAALAIGAIVTPVASAMTQYTPTGPVEVLPDGKGETHVYGLDGRDRSFIQLDPQGGCDVVLPGTLGDIVPDGGAGYRVYTPGPTVRIVADSQSDYTLYYADGTTQVVSQVAPWFNQYPVGPSVCGPRS